MARGIESLVSLNPFCPVESAQGGHADSCKFWLLDLGRCPPTPTLRTHPAFARNVILFQCGQGSLSFYRQNLEKYSDRILDASRLSPLPTQRRRLMCGIPT